MTALHVFQQIISGTMFAVL